MQIFINIALAVVKIFKVINLPPSPRYFTQIKPDVNGFEVKRDRVHPLNLCG